MAELHAWAGELEKWGAVPPYRAVLSWIQLDLREIRIEGQWFGESAIGHVAGLLYLPTEERHLQAASDLPGLVEERAVYLNNASQDVGAGSWVTGAGPASARLRVVTGICGSTAVELLRSCLWGTESLPEIRAHAWDAVALAAHPSLFGAANAYAGCEGLGAPELQALLAALQRDAYENLVPWALGRSDPLAARFPTTLRSYRPSGSYKVGESIRHPKFGVGEVEAVRGTRMEVRFESGSRALACSKPEA